MDYVCEAVPLFIAIERKSEAVPTRFIRTATQLKLTIAETIIHLLLNGNPLQLPLFGHRWKNQTVNVWSFRIWSHTEVERRDRQIGHQNFFCINQHFGALS